MSSPGAPFEFGQQAADDLSRRSSQAIARAIDVWAESIKRLASQPEFSDQSADLEETINNAFAFAERLLDTQRELTLNLVRTLVGGEEHKESRERNAP